MKHFNEKEKAYIDEVIRSLPVEKKEEYYNGYTKVKKESTLIGLILLLSFVGGPLFYLKGNLNKKIITYNVIYITFGVISTILFLYYYFRLFEELLIDIVSTPPLLTIGFTTLLFLFLGILSMFFGILGIFLFYFTYVKNAKLYSDCIDDFNYNEKYKILNVIL